MIDVQYPNVMQKYAN